MTRLLYTHAKILLRKLAKPATRFATLGTRHLARVVSVRRSVGAVVAPLLESHIGVLSRQEFRESLVEPFRERVVASHYSLVHREFAKTLIRRGKLETFSLAAESLQRALHAVVLHALLPARSLLARDRRGRRLGRAVARDAHESLRERHGVSSRHRKVIDDVVRVARGFARAHRRRD